VVARAGGGVSGGDLHQLEGIVLAQRPATVPALVEPQKSEANAPANRSSRRA